MAWKRYSRKLSAIERASLALNELCKYNVEMVVEGEGSLSVEALREAVATAAAANPGSRVRLRGVLGLCRWVDSGESPVVREVTAPAWTARCEQDAAFLEEKFDPLRGGPICDVIYLPGRPTRLIFRAAHAAVDGRSLLHWASEVFRALRGEPLLGSPSTYIDWDIMRKFQDKVDREALQVQPTEPNIPVIPCSTVRKSGARYIWRTLVLPTLVPNALAKFAIFLAQYARRSGSGQVAFIVPVDLRTLREEVLSLGNLTGYMMMPLGPDDTPRHFSRLLGLRVRQHADCHRPAILARLPWIPMWLIRRSIAQGLERSLYEVRADAMSGGVVSMGTYPLTALSTPQFKATLTVPIPGFSGKLNVVIMPNEHQTAVSFAAPENYNLDGQLDELVASCRRHFDAKRAIETANVT